MKKIIVISIICLCIGIGFQPTFANNMENNPPYTPSNYYPCGEIEIPFVINLSWDGGDPDSSDTVYYDVYLDDDNPPQKIATVGPYPWNQTRIEYGSVELEYFTTYYMKIGAYDNHDAYTEGCVCSFKTGDNHPPNVPTDPVPPDGATNWTGGGLCWTGGDPDGDTVTYDVYFGNYSPPPLIFEDIPFNCTDIGCIEFNTTYYWKIVATDEHGASTPGPIWTFTTRGNSPPIKPIIIGYENETLYFYSIDPDGDDIRYIIDWGDGDTESTIWYPSGQIVEMSHTYFEGVYHVRIKAEDEFGAESPWSDPYTIKIGNPPTEPIIDGPTHGKVGVEYTYTFNTTYYEYGYEFFFIVDWGDDSPIEYVNPNWYNTSEPGLGIANHSWDKKGTYTIKAKTRDIHGRESPWGTLTVTMPRNKSISNILLLRILERFPIFQQLLDVWRVFIE
jgi:hypothetical protein